MTADEKTTADVPKLDAAEVLLAKQLAARARAHRSPGTRCLKFLANDLSSAASGS